MNRYWSNLVSSLQPYTPGEQPQDQQYIKLNTNESPYPPSPRVTEVMQTFDYSRLARYPDPESRDLVKALADRHQLQPDQVFVGNGSDEVLAHCFQAFFKQTMSILFPDISYSFYPVYCSLFQIEYRQPELDDQFRIRLDDYATDNGGIIIPNPNAPTGIALELGQIRSLLENNRDSVVIIDEAYVDFGAQSACQLIDEFDNLLVVQTFSKSRSLAAIRIGFACGNRLLIEALQRVKNSFNSYPISSLNQAAAIAAVEDEEYFQQTRRRIIDNREQLTRELQTMDFEVLPSSANFVFAEHRRLHAEDLYQRLKSAGILVRYFNKQRINNHLRISVGDETECQALTRALQAITNER